MVWSSLSSFEEFVESKLKILLYGHRRHKLVESLVHNRDEVWEMLKVGGKAVGSTNANLLSRRSRWM
ncbi:hypothetical protein AAC387_Pa06g2247 [Persea americana]